MTILVDMDDTIEGLLDAWTTFINNTYGMNVRAEDIDSWDLKEAYPTLTKEQIFAPIFEEALWQAVKPFPDAVYYLERLINDGHDVLIVTASHYDNVGMKMRNVLLKHFPFIPYENVIVAHRKQMILGDVLIDDHPGNLVGGKYKGFLYTAPHNRHFRAEKYGMTRVSSWSQIYDIINDMDKSEFDEIIADL